MPSKTNLGLKTRSFHSKRATHPLSHTTNSSLTSKESKTEENTLTNEYWAS